jgi:hypothetical protein
VPSVVLRIPTQLLPDSAKLPPASSSCGRASSWVALVAARGSRVRDAVLVDADLEHAGDRDRGLRRRERRRERGDGAGNCYCQEFLLHKCSPLLWIPAAHRAAPNPEKVL